MFKEKICFICGSNFTPVSPNQKYCLACKDVGSKITSRRRDIVRNRKRFGYVKLHKTCIICGAEFDTYYNSKKYCGSEVCEKARIKFNRKEIDIKRNNLKKNLTILRKGREQQKKIIEIENYVSLFNYKLINADDYKSSHTGLLKLLCPNGHYWNVTYHGFKDNKARCLHCYLENNYVSAPEQIVRHFLEENLPSVEVIYNDRSLIGPKELDFYFPRNKLAIEVCGLYWHGEISSGKDKQYHYDKMKACYDKGVRLITIFEDELNKKPDVVLSRVCQALGSTKNKIYARKCKVLNITNSEANAFFDLYHLQGKTNSIKAWGLFYKDKLLSVCSIGHVNRKHTGDAGVIELKRFCSLPYMSVVGGAMKLFKAVSTFCIENGYKVIKSYCDMRYANIFNVVYDKMGFDLISYSKYTPHYFMSGNRYRNISLRKTKEEQVMNKTEWELRKEQGYDRIWDCGHRTYCLDLCSKDKI